MTYEEQQYMIQELSDRLQSEKKEKKELQDLVSALTSPRLSEYGGLYKQIEEQQKVIDEQQETIENQKKSLREVLFRKINQGEVK